MTNYLATGSFWAGTVERALKTLVQGLIAVLGLGAFNLFSFDWKTVLGVGLGAAVLSVLTSLVSGPIGPQGSPSLVSEAPAGGPPSTHTAPAPPAAPPPAPEPRGGPPGSHTEPPAAEPR